MGLICLETACLHMLCYVVFASCIQSNDTPEPGSTAHDALPRFRRNTTQKILQGHFQPSQENEEQRDQDTGHQIHRVRRSWFSDYLDDLWSHVRISFPRAVLYAFPFAVLIMSLLCCITILID